jgi:hypothetical protein
MQALDNYSATFYTKSSTDSKIIELVDNYDLTNDFKQLIYLPYFKDIYKVFT